MATRIKHKRSSVAGKKPIFSQLESGELALNTADGKVFLLRDDNTVQDITKRIFENNSEIVVSDPGDSVGAITVTVDGSDKILVTPSGISLKDDTTVEDAGYITFKELTASGNDGIGIKAPNTLDAGYNLTLPPSIGIKGNILKLGASNQLEFTDADTFGGNVVYVSAEQGDDANDGRNEPVKTVKRACQIASSLVYNPDGTTNGVRVNVKVAVGDYTEQNPIIVPDNVVIKGDGLRGCIIRPANEDQDMLRVRSACYFGEFTFRDGVDASFIPIRTWGYATAFDDPSDITVSRVGYTNLPTTKPLITSSPYIQNCSIISFLGGSGAKIDGSLVATPNVSAVSIEAENPVIGSLPEQGKSMVANAFTMLSFGGTGWRLTNDAYAQIVSCFQIFLLNGIYCQSGGYCSITNSATNFGLYALRASGYSSKTFDFDRGYVVATGLSSGERTLSIIGINREAPVNEFVVRFRDPDLKIAYDLIESNKAAIAQDLIDWQNAQIAGASPGSIWYNFVYNQTTWLNNMLLALDAVARDSWSTGNSITRQTALSYYNGRLADSSEITISGQEEQYIAAFEQLSVFTAAVIVSLDSPSKAKVDSLFDLLKEAISDPASIPDAVDVSSVGDITNSFKNPPTETTFDPSTGVSVVTNIFTIAGHGFSNLQSVVYDANGNTPIGGLDQEQTYYVGIINENEFTLYFDNSGSIPVNVTSVPASGTHKFLTNITEFYVHEILSNHSVYQRLILESAAGGSEFVPGRAITGATGALNNSAYVYSWKPAELELIVSVELVSSGTGTVRNQFSAASVIAQDHAAIPNTSIGVNEVSPVTGLGTATFTVTGTVEGSDLTNLVNLPENQVWFHRPSVVNSSSHTWEYAGSGIDYNALPQNGGNTIEAYEQYSELPGRVYSSGTNELGDFKVGNFITAFNRTGNITFRNKVTVDTLDALRLSLSNVAIEEISTDVNLGDNELGGPKDTRLSTQLAIRSFLSNRLGGFIDKSVSTAAVPGAIVQLNTNGQLNPDLIPATRQFTSTTTNGYGSKLVQVDYIPAVDLKAGDIATEEYEQIELTFASGVTAADGALITQAVTGAQGYAKGSYAGSLNMIVASIGAEFKSGDDSTGTDFDTTHIISVNGVSTSQAPSALGSSAAIVDNYFLKRSVSSQYLVLSNTSNYTFTADVVVDQVTRSTDVATYRTVTQHNLQPGNDVQVITTVDTTFTKNGIVLSAPTTTTFTMANPGTNKSATADAGTVRTVVTSADGNAQGAVTEVRYGVLSNVDNAAITGGSGYTPASGTLTYSDVPFSNNTGVGVGATCDVTVTNGAVADVDIKTGGTGYAIGDMLSVESNYLGEDSAGIGFEIEVTATEKRAYVNILGGELFVASTSSVDFVEDNTAPASEITVTLTDTISNNFLAGDTGIGDVAYATSRITIAGHGLTNGDPITYSNLGNVSIGGLINGSVYYAKVITSSIIEIYADYSLLSKISFTSTPANNNHNFTRHNVNITDNSVIVLNHGYNTGDAFSVSGNDLFKISATTVVSDSRFFVGSKTTNSFTLHELRSDALASINSLVVNARDITAKGTGTAIYRRQNVQVNTVVNTSSRLKENWNSLAATNIDASNIISGTISPTRLAGSGTANTDTFLRGDSSYQPVVQSLKKSNTTDNPITLTGSNVAGEYYGDPVNIGISNVDYDGASAYSTLGVARFLQTQFDVDVAASGQVFIKDGVVDAGTLDALDSAYFLNPANLTSAVPVNRGGTAITTYAIGDLIYAQSSGSLNTVNIGRNNSFLKSNGTTPEWGTALDLAQGLDVGSAKLSSTSTGIGKVYNDNVTSLELGSSASTVKIGTSSANRNIKSFMLGFEATSSTDVAVNFGSFTINTNASTANGKNEVPMTNTTGILAGMLVTGSASIPANTTVSGITSEYLYLSNNTTGTINSGVTLSFTYTPDTLGIRAGDTINLGSTGITNLDGSWPVSGATFNATSFTVRTDLAVTANPATAIAGGATITKDNTMVIKNRNVIFGSAEASVSPVAATLKGESGIGTDVAGGSFIIQAGTGTGNATGGNIVLKTGAVSTTSALEHVATTRLTIDTSGKAQFTGEVGVAGTLSTTETTVNLLDTTATTINMGGAATIVDIGAATGTTNVKNNLDVDLDLNVDGGDITTSVSTFNLINTTATTLNIGGAATTLNIGNASGTVTIAGDLTVNGTTTTVNSTVISVDDKNIELGSIVSPTDITADGGGITLKGATDKTLNWVNATDAWTSSEHLNLASGKAYYINNASVLNSTTLGSAVVDSSLTKVGTITTGAWQADIVSPTYGGTGINNGTKTITLGGNFTHTGAHTLGLTTTGATSVTLPTSGTLAVTGSGLNQFAATTSAELAGVISDETGTGALVFGTNPNITTSITTATATFALFNTNATTINFAGAATALNIGAATGTTNVKNNLDVDLDLYVDGGDIITSAATFNLINTTATTLNIGGAATDILIGAASGTTRIRNIVDIDLDLNVDGGDITTNVTGAFGLINSNATIINAFGAGTDINIGATTGDLNIKNATVTLDGDLAVNGADITTSSTGTFNLVNTNATTVNIGGAASVISIGNATSTTTVRDDLTVTGVIIVSDTTAASSTITGAVKIAGGLGVAGAVHASSFTGSIAGSNIDSGTVPNARIAVGAVTQHQASITGTGALNSGSITSGFGAIDIGADNLTATGTVSLGATSFNENNITNVGSIALDTITADDGVSINFASNTVVNIDSVTESSATTSGALVVDGGVGIAKNLRVAGTIHGDGSGLTTLNADNLSSGTVGNARITGTYSNLTGTGALDAGSITANFGDINIGINTFTGNGSGLTNITADTAATLAVTRTLWGQNFNGSANVTGNLTSVGNITGTAGIAIATTTTGVLDLDSGTTGAINIGTNANAKTLTLGNVTGATGIVLNSGTAGVSVNTVASGQFKVQASAAPIADMVNITNTGFGTVTAGKSALQVTYVGGAAAIEASAARIDIAPGGTTGGTWSALRLVPTAAASGVTVNLIKADAFTAGAGTENVMYVGTGYNSIINYNGTSILDGTGANYSGNAATATILATSRNINGVAFNGSADITITANIANALTINNGGAGAVSGTTFNGSSAVTISYNSIGASPLAGSASLTTTGTVTSGTWQGTIIGPTYGGTGVNNGARTITLNTGNLTLAADAAGSSVTVPASGTLAVTSNKLSVFAATTSAELAGVISDETGSGVLVFATSPTFTTTIDGGATFGAFASSTALTLGYTGTAASTTNISTGATASTVTKTVNLGTGGALGSATNINIGDADGGTTTIASPNITISGLADTATTATHYYVETTGGNILPKTLANVKTEIVTTAAVNSAAATTVGTVTSGTWSASFGAVSGANLTSLTAGNLSGTIPSGVLGNSSHFIGTTSIALNRASLAQTLTGVSIDGSAGSCTGNAGTVTNGVYTTGNQSIAGIKTFSNGTASTTNTTGSVVITGGLGVSGAINAGGEITAYATSDTRLKTNIENITNALAKVNQLNGVTYNWNDLAHEVEHKDTSVRDVGVLAPQVNDVLPEVITIRENGYMAVRYEKMVPLLIEAIKEGDAKAEAQAAEIAELKAMVKALLEK